MERSPGGSLAQTLTYNTLIKGLGRELRVDEAFGVARGMVDRGCFPNEVSYRCCFAAAAETVEAAAFTQPRAAWVGDEMACLHQGVCLLGLLCSVTWGLDLHGRRGLRDGGSAPLSNESWPTESLEIYQRFP